MSEDAYGLLCSFVPPVINPMEEEGRKALKAAVEGVSTTADNIRSIAEQYRETDSENEKEFHRVLKDPAMESRG